MTDSEYAILFDQDNDVGRAAVLDVPRGTPLAVVAMAVEAAFATDPAADRIALRVGGAIEGVISRHRLATWSTGWRSQGDADGATLPGPSNQYRVLRFDCAEPACDAQERRIHVDPRSVPECPLGHGAMVIVR